MDNGHTTDITLYFTINADGEFEVGTEQEEAEERFRENIMSSGQFRTYAVEVTDVTLPDAEPPVIRVSMKQKQKDGSPAHIDEGGPMRVGGGWSFAKA